MLAAVIQEAYAHSGPLRTPQPWWTAWSTDWWLCLLIGLSGVLYVRGVRRLWQAAAVGAGVTRIQVGAFATGWALNIVGHQLFEKRAPAFSDDGLSFIAGPVWDLQEVLKFRRAG